MRSIRLAPKIFEWSLLVSAQVQLVSKQWMSHRIRYREMVPSAYRHHRLSVTPRGSRLGARAIEKMTTYQITPAMIRDARTGHGEGGTL